MDTSPVYLGFISRANLMADSEHDSPETVHSVLRVVKLDCRAGRQIQCPDRFGKLQQRHFTTYTTAGPGVLAAQSS